MVAAAHEAAPVDLTGRWFVWRFFGQALAFDFVQTASTLR